MGGRVISPGGVNHQAARYFSGATYLVPGGTGKARTGGARTGGARLRSQLNRRSESLCSLSYIGVARGLRE